VKGKYMIKVKQLDTKALIATVCVAVSSCLVVQAQEASTDRPVPTTQNQPALAESTRLASDQQTIAANKCSKLMGAQVKDQRGESLGRIDDVVVDYNTGRVSYCSMKVDSQLGGPKHLPIPLAALRPSTDGQYFILNADREKIAQARGFSDNNWPGVNTPAWGAEPFAQATEPQQDQGQYIPTVTVTGNAEQPDLNIATLPVPAADGNIGNQATVTSPSDQFVTSPTGPFPTFTHVYLPGAVPR
jgi:hypothetical protein